MKEIYHLESFDVPLFEGHPVDLRLKIEKPIIVEESSDWIEKVAESSI